MGKLRLTTNSPAIMISAGFSHCELEIKAVCRTLERYLWLSANDRMSRVSCLKFGSCFLPPVLHAKGAAINQTR